MFDLYPEVMRELLCAATLHRVTELAAFWVDPPGDVLRLAHHVRPDAVSDTDRDAARQAFADIVGDCMKQLKDGVVRVSLPDGDVKPQFCLVLLSPERPTPAAAAAFILRCRDESHARAALDSLRAETPLFRSGRALE